MPKHPLPRYAQVLIAIAKPLLVPVIIGVAGVYFHYRLEHAQALATTAKKQATSNYTVLRDPVEELQAQLLTLATKVDLLQRIVLAQANGAPPVTRVLDAFGDVGRLRQAPLTRPRVVRLVPPPAEAPPP